MDFKLHRKFAKGDSYLRHFCLSVWLQQLGSFWENFLQTGYLIIFRKSIKGIQIPLNSAKNSGQFVGRAINIVENVLLVSF